MLIRTNTTPLLLLAAVGTLIISTTQASSQPPPGSPPGTPGLPPPPPPQVALDAARSNWDFQNTGFYDFQYTKLTMLSWQDDYPWTVKVRRGRVSEVVFSKNGTRVPLEPLDPRVPPTITDLLDTIQSAIDNRAHSVDVSYSSTYGYPIDITIDYNQHIGDDELYAKVSGYVEQPAYERQVVQDALTDARNLWFSYGIDVYTFDYEESCMACFSLHYPWMLQVFHGQTRAMNALGQEVTGHPLADVPHLFDVLQDALDRQAFDIQVSYHPDLGFPTSLHIDYDPRIADEELTLSVSSMNVMNDPRAELVLAQRQWSTKDYSSYTYKYQEMSHTAGDDESYPWVVEVQNKQIVKATDANNQIVTGLPLFASIENTFHQIEEALNTGAHAVDVSYSKTIGLPESVFLDQDSRPGDERTIQISNFQLVQQP